MKSTFLRAIKGKVTQPISSTLQHSTVRRGRDVPKPHIDDSRSGKCRLATQALTITEAPPPYKEVIKGSVSSSLDASPAHSQASRVSARSLSTPEDPYAFLSTFDTIFLIDDSGSMAGQSWREVKSVLANIAPICTAHDDDGVDVYFLNHRSIHLGDTDHGKAAGGYNVTDDAVVETLFTKVLPTAATPTGKRVSAILKPYLQHYEAKVRETGDPDNTGVKPVNMIVITDGVPTDNLESVLRSAAQTLDRLEAPPFQVGVQFFQVGKEPSAAEALRELDDNMGNDVRDMVDTVSWDTRDGSQPALTADAILKTVLGAVVRRVDRMKALPRPGN